MAESIESSISVVCRFISSVFNLLVASTVKESLNTVFHKN